ncbi:MAG: ABC transporter ATP-binding protein [Henriciella sp.]|nr:ABC transporter ATP-binding protein [Henriciella sp.]
MSIAQKSDSSILGDVSTYKETEKSPLAIEVSEARIEFPLGQFTRGSLKTLLFSLFGHREASLPMPFVNAIKNVSFDVAQGERIGIIGHNGAGKSTMLRALAGIYPLKSGSITVSGQVGSLLDVGLGFEPESTGRENIYYRGMSMGISRKEMKKHEQAIIDFAELGDFIDLPMRTYSTGMFVRLGFAVSTQFKPDILLIDEVFGAGDAIFQKRALARMHEIVEQAGIVVIATHDLGLVQNLCTRTLLLDDGSIVFDGAPADAIDAFNALVRERSSETKDEDTAR